MAFDNGSEQRRPFARWLAGGARRLDLAVIAAVPLVLVAVFALPEPVRRSLAFDYTRPSVLTAYAAPFVHLEWSHLLVNVLGYAVVVPVAYGLSVASGTVERFRAAFVTFVLVFPPVLSLLNLAVVRPTVGVGFSGVLLAFVGYMPLALADYLSTGFDVGPRHLLSPAVFFTGLTLVAVLSMQSVLFSDPTVLLGTALLVVATLLSAVLFLVAALDRAGATATTPAALRRSGYVEFGVAAGVVFFGFPFVAFPPDPAGAGGILNLYVHLLGYALGFMVTYSAVAVDDRVPDLSSV
ncbi:hypothetical protein [Halosimplex salinum]|uniref:hypothetical protein n=1 Tax=Halosimplex salinum TaxID=1710538 RepID=UPI000F4A6041|nr:hypothetical protein [Halosimplex salinum]